MVIGMEFIIDLGTIRTKASSFSGTWYLLQEITGGGANGETVLLCDSL